MLSDEGYAQQEVVHKATEDGRVLGIVQGGSKMEEIGASYFDGFENSVAVLSRACALGNDYADVLQKLVAQVHPTCIVVSNQVSDDFYGTLKRIAQVEIKRLSNSVFEKTSVLRKLEELGFPPYTLRSLLDVENEFSLASVGGTLHFAAKSDMIAENSLTKIELVNLEQYMMIDLESLHELDVIKEETHPSITRKSSKKKDGFSLLMMFLDRVKSHPGKKTLRKWVTQPLADVSMINYRLDAVDYLVKILRQSNRHFEDILGALKGLKDVTRAMYLIRKRVAHAGDWACLAESMSAVQETLDLLHEFAMGQGDEGHFLPDAICDILEARKEQGGLKDVNRVLGVIDWPKTKELGHVVPEDGVSEELDHARDRFRNLDPLLCEISEEVQHIYRDFEYVHELAPTYMPLLGFMITVPGQTTDKYRMPTGFRERFARDDIEEFPMGLVYFQCDYTDDLNRRIGDLYGDFRELELKIVRDVESAIMSREQLWLYASQKCAELDVLLAFAATSNDFGYVRPIFVAKSNKLVIKGGVHPVLSLAKDQYLPNDVTLGRDAGSKDMMLLTGPAYSGKSALLKTVALIVIMAQIGCFVSAEDAELGPVDRLFMQVESFETSASIMESSFSLDVQQISRMIRNYSPRSLLIIDEFGKGTNPIDGASLLSATIKHLSQGNEFVPRTIITTHFLEIFQCDVIRLSENIWQGQMQVLLHDPENEDEETQEYNPNQIIETTPLYKLIEGHTGSSYALTCAKHANVPADILGRAHVILQLLEKGLFPSDDPSHDFTLVQILRKDKTFWHSTSEQEIQNILSGIQQGQLHSV